MKWISALLIRCAITTYDDQLKGTLKVLKFPHQAISEQGEGWLLIDDLVDTGTTAKEALRLLPKVYFFTVYAKPQGLSYVNTYSHDVEQDVWVFFRGIQNPNTLNHWPIHRSR